MCLYTKKGQTSVWGSKIYERYVTEDKSGNELREKQAYKRVCETQNIATNKWCENTLKGQTSIREIKFIKNVTHNFICETSAEQKTSVYM